LQTLREAVGAELEKRHGIELERHWALFDAVWRNIEHETAEGMRYLEFVLAYNEFEEAVDELAGAVEDDALFPYFLGTGQNDQAEGGSEEQAEPTNDSPRDEIISWRDVSLDWNNVYTARAEAFSEYVAKILSVDAGVMRFRQRLLGDSLRTLSRDEANNLALSLASRFFDFGRFRKLCTPLGEKEIVLEEYGPVQQDGRLLLRATISVEPPGVAETLFRLHPSQDPLLNFVWPWGETERPETFQVWPNSVLGQLHRISVRLAQEHPWSVEDASLFILTGETLFISPFTFRTLQSQPGVDAHKYKHNEVTLTVAPWVPGEVILEAHRKIRKSLGYNDRRPSERYVALFRFVVAQSDVHIVKKREMAGLLGHGRARLRLPKWKELRREWNERYPAGHEWHYGQKDPHAKLFRRDFVRAQEKIIGTPYGLPGIPGWPMTRDEEQRMVEGLLGATERADSQQGQKRSG
jgi:hypothetical protein